MNTKTTISEFDFKGLEEKLLAKEKVNEKIRKTLEQSKAQKQSNLKELEKLSIPEFNQTQIQFNISQSPIKDYNELDQISSTMKYNQQVNLENQSLKRKQASKLKEEGNRYYNSSNYQLAVQKYSEALDLQPENKALWLNRAISFIKLNEFGKAVEDCSQVLKIALNLDGGFTQSKDYCFKAFLRGALAKSKMANYQEALDDLEEALRLETNNSEAISLKTDIENKLLEIQHQEIQAVKFDKQTQVDLVTGDCPEIEQKENQKIKDIQEKNQPTIQTKVEIQTVPFEERINVQLNYKDVIDNFTENLRINIYSPSDTRDCSPAESDKQKQSQEKIPQTQMNENYQRGQKGDNNFQIRICKQLFALFKSIHQNKEEWAAYFYKKRAIETLITIIKQDQELIHDDQNLIPSLPALILQHYFEVSYIYQEQFFHEYNGLDLIFSKVIRLLQKAEGKKNSAIFDTVSDYFDALNIMNEEKIRKIIQKSPQIQTVFYPEIFVRIMNLFQTETNLVTSFLSFCANLCYDQDSYIRLILYNSFEFLIQQFKLIFEKVQLNIQTNDMFTQLINLITNLFIEEKFRKKILDLDFIKEFKEFIQNVYLQFQQLQNIQDNSYDELKISYLGFFLNFFNGLKINEIENLIGELKLLKNIIENYNLSRNLQLQERASNLLKLLNQCYLFDNAKQKNSER